MRRVDDFAFKPSASANDARARVVESAREQRGERARAKATVGAVLTCQRIYRTRARERGKMKKAKEAFDAKFGALSPEALPTDDAVFDDMLPMMLKYGEEFGVERRFRVMAIVLTRVDAFVGRSSLDVTTRTLAAAARASAERSVRARLPAFAMCGVKLACAIAVREPRCAMNALAHAALCEALTEIVSDETFAQRAAATRALAPLVTKRMLSSDDESDDAFDGFAVRLMRVPSVRDALPANAVEALEEPKALRRALAATRKEMSKNGAGASDIAQTLRTIENAVALVHGRCQKSIKARRSNGDGDSFADLALMIADLCAAAAKRHERCAPQDVPKEACGRARTWCDILSEPSFVLGLIGEREPGMTEWRVCSSAKAGILARAYDAMLRSAQPPSILSQVFPESMGTTIYSVCAFTPGFLRALWRHLSEHLSLAQSLSTTEAEQPSKCIAKAFENGAELNQLELLKCFGFFCTTYSHALVVLRDAQFFDEQSVFSLDEQRAIVVSVNTLVVRTHAVHKSGLVEDWMIRLIKSASMLLRALVTRDSRRTFCSQVVWTAPNSEQNNPEVMAARFQRHIDGGEHTFSAGLLQDAPSSLSFASRVKIFRELIIQDRDKAKYRPQAGGMDAAHNDIYVRAVAEIAIRRQSVLEDALAAILPLGSKARGRLLVKYVNAAGQAEAGIDAGGLFKELLQEIIEKALDPNRGLFTTNAANGIYPSPRAGDMQESLLLLEMVGMMVGKALYEGILQEINLAPFFAATILGIPRTIDDIASLDEELHRGCVKVLEYDGDFANLCLDFTVSEDVYGQIITRELIKNGANIEVTNVNRRLYIHALADYHLNRRLAIPVNAFMKGLKTIINKRWLSLFTVKELQLLLNGGEAPIDVDDWEAHTQYSGGYTARSFVVRNFWRTMRKFSPSQRRDVLKFVTSSSRPPLQGFKHLNPPFVIHKVDCEASPFAYFGAEDVNRLPSASTCFNMLKLPNYRRLATLEKSLNYAAESRAGFELS